jgi:transposase
LRGHFGEVHRHLLEQALQRLRMLSEQVAALNQLAAKRMQPHASTVQRLIEVPGVGAEAAQAIVAEIGPTAAALPSSAQLASWMGVCPGSQESAGQNYSGRCAKGNRYIRSVLCQVAHAAVRTKGSHLQTVFRRFLAKLGCDNRAIWAVLTRSARLFGISCIMALGTSNLAELSIQKLCKRRFSTTSKP